MPVVSSIIRHHANLGDVQTSVTILMALGETRRRGVDLDVAEQEHLLLGYLDMLSRRRLYDVATLVNIFLLNFDDDKFFQVYISSINLFNYC